MSGRDIRDAVGLLAVVAGLVFVAVELRQTNAAIRGAAYQGLADGYRDFQIMMAEDPERLEVFRRWWTEPPGDILTARDSLQVHTLVLAMLRNFENTERQLAVGLISEDEATAFFGFSFVPSQAFARWWDQGRVRYSDAFVRFMEESILPGGAGA